MVAGGMTYRVTEDRVQVYRRVTPEQEQEDTDAMNDIFGDESSGEGVRRYKFGVDPDDGSEGGDG